MGWRQQLNRNHLCVNCLQFLVKHFNIQSQIEKPTVWIFFKNQLHPGEADCIPFHANKLCHLVHLLQSEFMLKSREEGCIFNLAFHLGFLLKAQNAELFEISSLNQTIQSTKAKRLIQLKIIIITNIKNIWKKLRATKMAKPPKYGFMALKNLELIYLWEKKKKILTPWDYSRKEVWRLTIVQDCWVC